MITLTTYPTELDRQIMALRERVRLLNEMLDAALERNIRLGHQVNVQWTRAEVAEALARELEREAGEVCGNCPQPPVDSPWTPADAEEFAEIEVAYLKTVEEEVPGGSCLTLVWDYFDPFKKPEEEDNVDRDL